MLTKDPVARAFAWIAFAAGVVAAVGPTGLHAEPVGLGVLGGAAAGVSAGCVLAPFLAAGTLLFSSWRAEVSGMREVLLLAGIPKRRALAHHVGDGALVAAASICTSTVGGVLCGLGDSVRQGSRLFAAATVDPSTVAWSGLGAIYLLTLAGAVVATTRHVTGALLCATACVTLLPLILATRGTSGHWLPYLHPLAPLWAATGSGGYFALHLPPWVIAVTFAGWGVVGTLVCWWATRSPRSGRDGRASRPSEATALQAR
jgi:hypothetical protein